MSQIAIPEPTDYSTMTIDTFYLTGAVLTTIGATLQLGTELFSASEPVTIVDGKLKVNENLLEENKTYPISFGGKEYFVRRHEGTTEIFQIKE